MGKQGITRDTVGTSMTLHSDDIVVGRILGKGSSAIVQQALHKPTNSQIALKTINVYDKEKRKQLMNDIKAMEHSECPFLVRFYGAYFEEGYVKVALEYMNGGSLRDCLARSRTVAVPENILSKVTQQVLNGLMYLHKIKHQVHRDIKPDNVLVDTSGAVKLSDFGITKDLGVTIGICNTFVGTVIYMSPERINGKKYSYSSDVWSLGLMLIELATGRYPYPKTNTYIEMVENIMTMPDPSLPRTFTEEFRDFVSHCVKKLPEQRWSVIQLAAHPWVLKFSQSQANISAWARLCLRG